MQQGWGRPGIVTHKPCIKLCLISWQPCESGAISILQMSRVRLWSGIKFDQGSNSELSGYKAYLPPTIVHANSSSPMFSPTRARISLGLGFGMTLNEVWLAKKEQKQRTAHLSVPCLCLHACWYNSQSRKN